MLPDAQGRGAHPPADGPSPAVVRRWYALRLRSQHEFAVRDALEAAGVTTFLPTTSVETRRADRTTSTTRPLFKGYIFARFEDARQNEVLQTRGVVQVLGSGDKPIPIDDDEIANLQRIAAMPAELQACKYSAGETVTMARGPFAGVSGVITRTEGAARLAVRIEILGRAVSVGIDAADVE